MMPDLIDRFAAIVGTKNALRASDDLTHYTHENRGLFIGNTPLVLKPATTEEVSAIMRMATETATPVIPQGGHTGHVGGAVSDESGSEIVVSLERLNKVREIDLNGNVLVCEAGCVLQAIQQIADDNGLLFPLALGSQGSCQIGGNISTNAGGTGVLAYGNTRHLVMGLEVVLPSGEIWNGLRRLKKDNTGYDLKDIFIGAEGTLGIVTAAVLKLFPKPKGKAIAFCGMKNVDDAINLLKRASEHAGQSLTAFEFMSSTPVQLTVEHMDGVRNPLAGFHEWHALIEVSSNRSGGDATDILEQILEQPLEAGDIDDAAVATSIAQQKDFWRLRETMPLAQKEAGGSMKHDISIPIHRIKDFLKEADSLILKRIPGARLYTFGHLGDGNIHYNITQPDGADANIFLSRQSEINEEIHGLVVQFDGSVAAEHGVGRLKRELIAKTKTPVELNLMRTIKASLDPDNIMNPGKVLIRH